MMKKIVNSEEMKKIIDLLAKEVKVKIGLENLVIIGIKRRGAILAERIKNKLKKDIPLGSLDITLYRDDFSKVGANPIVSETDILFDIDEKNILLVDDVLYTGRTIRAALDALIDFGRPSLIKLLVLIDRGDREFPIMADFVGKTIKIKKNQMVEVKVKELDGKDEVIIIDR